jgi:hypothetical protein
MSPPRRWASANQATCSKLSVTFASAVLAVEHGRIEVGRAYITADPGIATFQEMAIGVETDGALTQGEPCRCPIKNRTCGSASALTGRAL